MKYYIIAGERSGDLHASNLMKELKNKDANAEFRCWGGDYMQEAGAVLVKHYNELAFMGFIEVVKNLGTIKANLKFCKSDILSYSPDVVILVDYAGFNLRIADFAKKSGLKTFYYISPKVWAWNQKRALNIKKIVDRMFVIMPFEKEFYKKYAYEVDFVGNPVLDAIAQFKEREDFLSSNQLDADKPIIAILPGSRKQEVLSNLEKMIAVANHFPQFQFVVAAVPNLPKEIFGPAKEKGLKVVFNETYDLLSKSLAAIVTSGTATLETAMFEIPQMVCYEASPISYVIAKALIKVKYISLVNLLADKEVVKELIQKDFTPKRMIVELTNLTEESSYRNAQIEEYRKIKTELGKYKASERAAELMVGYLRKG